MSSIAVPLPRPRPGWAALRLELWAMLALALPLALTQVGQILIHTTEVFFLARLNAAALASVTIAWTLFYACFLFSLGVAQATAPLIAIAHGARQPRAVRRAVRQGLWVAFLVSLPCGIILWHGRGILAFLGQDPELLDGAETYLRAAVFGLPAAAGFVVLRNFVSTYGRTAPIMAVTYATVVVNVGLSYGLIFGVAGMPGLGILGAGIGAAVSWTLMFLLLLGYCVWSRRFRRFMILGRFWRPDWTVFREIWRLGLPIGAAMVLETGLFASATLMVGLIGTAELAAHQVTLQIAATSFMVPLGISIAATIRIGRAMGAGEPEGVRQAGWVAACLGAAFMGSCALIFWIAGGRLTGLFFDPSAPGSIAAMATAVVLIKQAALFQLADGLQVIGIANLRGMKDTAVPMWLAALGYWLVGVPACAALGFWAALGVRGIWLGLALALATVAIAMLLRFRYLTAPARLDPRLRAGSL